MFSGTLSFPRFFWNKNSGDAKTTKFVISILKLNFIVLSLKKRNKQNFLKFSVNSEIMKFGINNHENLLEKQYLKAKKNKISCGIYHLFGKLRRTDGITNLNQDIITCFGKKYYLLIITFSPDNLKKSWQYFRWIYNQRPRTGKRLIIHFY